MGKEEPKYLDLKQTLTTIDGKNKLKVFRSQEDLTVGRLLMEMLGGLMNAPNVENSKLLEAWDISKSLRDKTKVEWNIGEVEKVEQLVNDVTNLVYCTAETKGQLLAILRAYKIALSS